MALFTTNAAGDLSAGATWVGGVAPGPADTWLINHAVDWSTALSFGASAAAGAGDGITFGNSGKITFKAGWGATAKGDVQTGNATTFVERIFVDFQAGGTWTWDSSGAADPTNQHYKWKIGTLNFGYLKAISSNAANDPVTITSHAGGGKGYFDPNGTLRNGYFDFSNFLVTRGGNATNPWWNVVLADHTEAVGKLNTVIFDTCGELFTGLPGAGATIDFINVTWKSSAGARTWNGTAGMDPKGAVTRRMKGCIHDKLCNLYGARDMAIGGSGAGDWCVFYDSIEVSRAWASWRNVLIRTGTGQTVMSSPQDAPINDTFLLNDSGDADPHFIAQSWSSGGFTNVYDRFVFETRGSAGSAGNGILTIGPDTASTTTITRLIVLPDDGTDASANALHHYETGGLNVLSMKHCTVRVRGDGGGVNVVASTARMTALKDNIFWTPSTAVDNFKLTSSGTGLTAGDTIFGAGTAISNNGGWNSTAGGSLKGYNITGFAVAPGAGDVNGDPLFVDSARRLTKWDTSLGGPGTRANALTELMKKNESGYNSAYSVPALLTYIFAGYAFTNVAYHNTGSDGTDIGAGAFAGSSGTLQMVTLQRIGDNAK